jgi:LysR family transcriptional regulator, D-serine deaminase activator
MSFSSFTSLHIFAQIAGCLSFKEAAEALHLTQSALSHRIRKLEQELGFQLFVRQTRRIALTPEGERLYRQVSRHFGSVCHEIDDIRHQALRGTLEIGSTPTFAQHWLVPRLRRFYDSHPELSLQLRSKGSRVDFALHPADVWIDYGDGHYPGLESQLLLDEVLMPVCSPAYAEAMRLQDAPARLADCLLLHDVESIRQSDPRSEWRGWLTEAGLDADTGRHHYGFTHYDAAIIGARSGLGVAMGRYQLARALVARGELVFPFDTSYHQGLGYHVVTRREFAEVAKVRAFITWLQQEITEMPVI